MESSTVCCHKSYNKIAYHEYDYRPNWMTRNLIPINHENYNFQEKKNSQVKKEKENLHEKTDKGSLKILRLPQLLLVIRRQKHKSKRARTQAHNYNFDCDWLI